MAYVQIPKDLSNVKTKRIGLLQVNNLVLFRNIYPNDILIFLLKKSKKDFLFHKA